MISSSGIIVGLGKCKWMSIVTFVVGGDDKMWISYISSRNTFFSLSLFAFADFLGAIYWPVSIEHKKVLNWVYSQLTISHTHCPTWTKVTYLLFLDPEVCSSSKTLTFSVWQIYQISFCILLEPSDPAIYVHRTPPALTLIKAHLHVVTHLEHAH